MNLIETVISLLSLLTLAGQLAALFFIVLLLLKKQNRVTAYITRHAIPLGFFFSLVATLGSLFLSQIAHYEPCTLCWWQRIFMYPLVILFGVAYIKKQKDIYAHVLPLALIGGIIAVYHYIIQMIALVQPGFSTSCSATGVSCISTYFLKLGYITIPLMSLTSFTLIILVSIALWRDK